jgi:GDPmannose 4,6-dehydratase
MWLMLQQEKPNDYVIASGETRTICEFAEMAFSCLGMPIQWQGDGLNKIGIDKNSGKTMIKVNPKFFRPAEVEILQGNPTKAEWELGWKREISFEDLVERMAENDLSLVTRERQIEFV